jgi:hypothetical protein
MTYHDPDLANLRARWRHIDQQWNSIEAGIENDLASPEPYVSLEKYESLFDLIEEIVGMLTP